MPNEPLRVLIVDDHPMFRNGMRALLAADASTEVAGEATTGEEAIALAASLQPDVILMDIQMPGVSGIEATRQILHTSPHIRILVVTMFEDDQLGVHGHARWGTRLCAQGRQPGGDAARDPGGRQRRGDLQPVYRHAHARLLQRPATHGVPACLARADRPRARDPQSDRAGPEQRRHRQAARAQSQDHLATMSRISSASSRSSTAPRRCCAPVRPAWVKPIACPVVLRT